MLKVSGLILWNNLKPEAVHLGRNAHGEDTRVDRR